MDNNCKWDINYIIIFIVILLLKVRPIDINNNMIFIFTCKV